jgi:adenylate cyclase
MANTGPEARANTERLGRRLAAVVSADVVGYSRLVERDEEGTVRRLKENWRDIVLPAIELHRGRVVKLMGDGALIEFPSVVEAVRFSLEAQQEVAAAESSRSLEERIRYRIGVHLGDVIIDGDDIQGHGVNVSARLQGLADPGSVCVSDAVRTALGNTVPLAYEDLGPQEVKNIAEPVRAFRIRGAERAEKTMLVQSQRRKMITMPLFFGLLAAIIVAAVGAYFLYWQPQPPTAKSASGVESEPAEGAVIHKTELPSILVTPFANLSEDDSQEFFVDGLTEDLIADLSNLSGLFVISRSSAFTLKGQTMRPPQLAEMFGVAYVVNGSMRRAADRVRITAELIEAVNDRQVWAESYDRELIDIFAVQDEVKKRIVQALAVRLRPGEQRLVSTTPTKSVEAYEFYLRGRRAMNSNSFRSMNQAFWAFEKAIALDSEFAEAYASLAMTNVLDLTGTMGFGDWVRPPQRTRVQATALAQRAASLKPSLAIPDIVFARLSLWDGHYDRAIEHARRAVEHEPGNVDAYITQAVVLTAAGLHREAKAAIDEAFRRDPKPSPPAYAVLGMIQYALHEYPGAIATFEMYRKQSTAVNVWMAPAFLFAAYGQAGRKDEGQAIAPFGASIINLDLSLIQFQRFYRHPEDTEHLLDGLRKVGAPELPNGFDPRIDAGEQLTGPALGSLLFGGSFDVLCADWFSRRRSTVRFGEDGSIAWSPREDINDIGRSRLDADQICVRLPLLTRDRDTCFAVYRNGSDPTLDLGRGYAYVMVGPSLCYFSPQQ